MSNAKNTRQKKSSVPATVKAPQRVQEPARQNSVLENQIDAEVSIARIGFFLDRLYEAVGLPITEDLNEEATKVAKAVIARKYPKYVASEPKTVAEAPEAVEEVVLMPPDSECDAVAETKEI